MRLSTALILALITLLLLVPVGVIGASTPSAASSAPAAADSQSLSQFHLLSQSASESPPSPAEPRQVITIRLTADGDAHWAIESRFLLEDDDDVDDFLTFADEVTSGERDAAVDVESFDRFRSIAQDNTGRQMELTNASWDDPRVDFLNETDADDDGVAEFETETRTGSEANASVDADHRVGVISYSFTWTNFTEKDGNRIHLGDVFQDGDSTWFPQLTDTQRLVIERPPNYGYDQHQHSLTDRKLVWDGPHEFDAEEFTVIYLEGASPDPEEPETDDSILSRLTLGIGLLAFLAVAGAGGYYLVTRSTDSDDSAGAGAGAGAVADRTDDGIVTDGSTSSEAGSMPPDTGADDPSSADERATATASYDETGPDLEDEGEFDDDVDLDLLSDEERVHRLLRQNGGRMKQASIVKETGWSNAKVSQLLSKMDEDEEIEKLRIGRENLITHPEVDPTEID